MTYQLPHRLIGTGRMTPDARAGFGAFLDGAVTEGLRARADDLALLVATAGPAVPEGEPFGQVVAPSGRVIASSATVSSSLSTTKFSISPTSGADPRMASAAEEAPGSAGTPGSRGAASASSTDSSSSSRRPT